MTAPAFRSYQWIRQDWRVLRIVNGEIFFGAKCGDPTNRTKSGKVRLCLPFFVIKNLMRSESGKAILRNQINRKLRADRGVRVPYHPEIVRLMRRLEKRTPPDIPKQILIRAEKEELRLAAGKRPAIKIDKGIYKAMCSDPKLKKQLVRFCKEKQYMRK